MPFNGSGLFVRIRSWVADAAAGIKIRADYHDLEDDGFADGLSQCVARDGQSVIIGNIPMNSKRLVSLADPIDPQDASTKAYADTKLPLAGGTMTGALTVNGQITSATGYATRKGVPGPQGSSIFNFDWTGSYLNAWVDSTNLGALATTAYVEQRASDWAHAVADPKVNRAGDTMTGSLTVNGELVAAANYLRFGSSGGQGYILWNGGASYTLGGGGTIWHTGNLNPVQSVRLAGFGGGVVATSNGYGPAGGVTVVTSIGYSTLQYLTPGGWVTVGG
jgi:hypothetical protein